MYLEIRLVSHCLKITMTYQNVPQTDIAREFTAEFTDAFKICLPTV